MSNLLDAIQPGNRRIIVEGVSAPQARDTLSIVCEGATVADDPVRQRTIVTIPPPGDSGAWVSFAPGITTTGSAFVLGNGVKTGQYRRSGADSLDIVVKLVVGSTTNFGTGQLLFDFDAIFGTGAVEIDATKLPAGLGVYSVFLDDSSSPTDKRAGRVDFLDSTHLEVFPTGNALPIGLGVPWTWAAGDSVQFSVTFPFVFIAA